MVDVAQFRDPQLESVALDLDLIPMQQQLLSQLLLFPQSATHPPTK
jgi:hypothetical protein